MRRQAMVTGLMTLALAGCGSGQGGDNGADGNRPAPLVVKPKVLEPPPVQNTAQARPGPTFSPQRIDAIPAALRGRWGMVPEDCVAGHQGSKGVLTVAADALDVDGSHATASDMKQVSPVAIRATLHMVGGTREAELTALEEGRTMVLRDGKDTERYSRCPA